MKTRNKIILVIISVVTIVSSMVFPALGATISNSNTATYDMLNGVNEFMIERFENGYGIENNTTDKTIIQYWPTKIGSSTTTSGTYTQYAPIATQFTSTGPITVDRLEMQHGGAEVVNTKDGVDLWATRRITMAYKSHNDSSTITSNYYPTPNAESFTFRLTDLYATSEQIESMQNGNHTLLPIIRFLYDEATEVEFDIVITYNTGSKKIGQILVSKYDESPDELIANGVKLSNVIDLNKYVFTEPISENTNYYLYNEQDKSKYVGWIESINVTIHEPYRIGSPVPPSEFSIRNLVVIQDAYRAISTTPKREVEKFINENIENKIIVDNTPNISLSSFLIRSVGGFFDFEVFPGLTIGATVALVGGLGLLMLILKMIAGG